MCQTKTQRTPNCWRPLQGNKTRRKWDCKISNQLDQKEKLQEERDLLATAEARAHIFNQGVYNVITKIDEFCTTTHDEWYGNLRYQTPTLDKWHDHMAVKKATKKEIEQGTMDGNTPLAVVDSGTTSSVGKYNGDLHLTRRPSHIIF